MTFDSSSNTLQAIERPLYAQLGTFAIVVGALGFALNQASVGLAAAAGVGAALLYYMMLGVQVRRQAMLRHVPNVIAIIVSMAGRQIVCLAVPGACYLLLGDAWWASLVTLLIARHWVMVVGWRASAAMQASHS